VSPRQPLSSVNTKKPSSSIAAIPGILPMREAGGRKTFCRIVVTATAKHGKGSWLLSLHYLSTPLLHSLSHFFGSRRRWPDL
jgi:hypothetical protein